MNPTSNECTRLLVHINSVMSYVQYNVQYNHPCTQVYLMLELPNIEHETKLLDCANNIIQQMYKYRSARLSPSGPHCAILVFCFFVYYSFLKHKRHLCSRSYPLTKCVTELCYVYARRW